MHTRRGIGSVLILGFSPVVEEADWARRSWAEVDEEAGPRGRGPTWPRATRGRGTPDGGRGWRPLRGKEGVGGFIPLLDEGELIKLERGLG